MTLISENFNKILLGKIQTKKVKRKKNDKVWINKCHSAKKTSLHLQFEKEFHY